MNRKVAKRPFEGGAKAFEPAHSPPTIVRRESRQCAVVWVFGLGGFLGEGSPRFVAKRKFFGRSEGGLIVTPSQRHLKDEEGNHPGTSHKPLSHCPL